MSNGALEPAATAHVANTVIGYTIGTIATGAALVLAGPLLVPLGAVAGAVGLTLPFIGGALGGWIGWNKACSQASLHGIRHS